MTVELNHTIVVSRDQHAAAADLADLLGLETSTPGATSTSSGWATG